MSDQSNADVTPKITKRFRLWMAAISLWIFLSAFMIMNIMTLNGLTRRGERTATALCIFFGCSLIFAQWTRRRSLHYAYLIVTVLFLALSLWLQMKPAAEFPGVLIDSTRQRGYHGHN